MKTILTLIIVGMLCVTGWANTDAVLCGIRIVETQDQLHPPRGKLGERGPYQFRRSTWRMHTSSSFDLAENRAVANTVAKRHYAWIAAQLQANGIEPSPYNVALAWNAGVNAVILGNIPAVSRDYATRVLNIANTMPDEAPKPVWHAPILIAENPSARQETPASPAETTAPAPVPSAANVADATTTEPTDTAEVRYYNNPILLAFYRTPVPEPAKVTETLPASVNVSSNAFFAGIINPAVGRM